MGDIFIYVPNLPFFYFADLAQELLVELLWDFRDSTPTDSTLITKDFYCGPAQLTREQCSSWTCCCWGNEFDVLCCILSLRAGNKNKAMITSGRSMI